VCACATRRSFLHRHAEELGELNSKTLHELGLASKPLLTLPGHTPALDVFAAMARARVSAVGITAGASGALIANLSARRVLPRCCAAA
jgi:hypothetical protein